MLRERVGEPREPVGDPLAANPERVVGDTDDLDARGVVDADLRFLEAVPGDDGLGLGRRGLGLGEGARARGQGAQLPNLLDDPLDAHGGLLYQNPVPACIGARFQRAH